jgi:hypothetical protein
MRGFWCKLERLGSRRSRALVRTLGGIKPRKPIAGKKNIHLRGIAPEPFRRVAYGSNAEEVVRRAPCPVLLVNEDDALSMAASLTSSPFFWFSLGFVVFGTAFVASHLSICNVFDP